MTTTARICDDASNALEQAYVSLLEQSRFYNVNGRTLTIRDGNLHVLLLYDAAPNNPLLGDWLVLSYNNGNGATTTPVPDSNPTATFGLRRLSGTTGCNSFQGDYNLNGDAVVIGPLARTQIACPDTLMAQEQQIIAAFQGVGRVGYRGTQVELRSLTGALQVQLIRPYAVPAPSASPSASAAASASVTASPSASASASPTPSPSPTATPTAAPTATPTAAPTTAPTTAPTGSPAPTVVPPQSIPPTATCDLNATTGGATAKVATIVYPSNWFTVTSPANLACRYFSPTQITVPSDPSTLKTAVMIQGDPASTYDAALAAATNPTAWNVLQQQSVTVGGGTGWPATLIEATSTAGTAGYPVGTTRYGYLLDVSGKPAWIVTSGTIGTPEYQTNQQVVQLIASQSTVLVATPF
jgi:heat shock protein HslJ